MNFQTLIAFVVFLGAGNVMADTLNCTGMFGENVVRKEAEFWGRNKIAWIVEGRELARNARIVWDISSRRELSSTVIRGDLTVIDSVILQRVQIELKYAKKLKDNKAIQNEFKDIWVMCRSLDNDAID